MFLIKWTWAIIYTVTSLHVARCIKCHMCQADGKDSFGCAGNPTQLDHSFTTCMAQVNGAYSRDGVFVVNFTTKLVTSGYQFPSKKKGCFFGRSDHTNLMSVYCQCQDSDFCIDSFDLDKELNIDHLPKVTCNSNMPNQSSCKGNLCAISKTDKEISQFCSNGFLNSFADIFDSESDYPICLQQTVGESVVKYCFCVTDHCNNGTLIDSTTFQKLPIYNCYDHLPGVSGSSSGNDKCRGNYCLESSALDSGVNTSYYKACLNYTSKLTTFKDFKGKMHISGNWHNETSTLCAGNYCNGAISLGRFNTAVLLLLLLVALMVQSTETYC